MDYSAIIFTPYSVRTGIVDEILKDLSCAVPYGIVWRKKVKLTVVDIETMYPRLVATHFFPRIIECFTGGEVECVLVVADKVHEKINSVKGKFRYEGGKASTTGLRAKFQRDSESFEFLFHSTDSNTETDEICSRLFGEEHAKAGIIPIK